MVISTITVLILPQQTASVGSLHTLTNAIDGTEDELLYKSEEENDVEVDPPDSDWDSYYDETVNDDLYDELYASDDDDSSNFEGF